MSFTSLLLVELVLVSTITASHFYGGSMTFNPRRNSDGSYEVELRYKTTYHDCYGPDYWSCNSGNCGNDVSSVIGEVDSSLNGNNWCQSEGVIRKVVSSNSPFEVIKASCCWIYNTVTNSGPWSLLTYIDLGVRSDTLEPNRSPISTTLPFVRVPQNCPRRYNLLAFDPDDDQVRCRFGLQQNNECGICNQPDGFTLDQDNCSLSYGQTLTRGVYSFELVMEDFPIRKITLSYTNLPLREQYPISLVRKRRSLNVVTTDTTTESTIAFSSTTPMPTTTTTPVPTTTLRPTTTLLPSTTTTMPTTTSTPMPTTTSTPMPTTTSTPVPTTTSTPMPTTPRPTTSTPMPTTTTTPMPTTTSTLMPTTTTPMPTTASTPMPTTTSSTPMSTTTSTLMPTTTTQMPTTTTQMPTTPRPTTSTPMPTTASTPMPTTTTPVPTATSTQMPTTASTPVTTTTSTPMPTTVSTPMPTTTTPMSTTTTPIPTTTTPIPTTTTPMPTTISTPMPTTAITPMPTTTSTPMPTTSTQMPTTSTQMLTTSTPMPTTTSTPMSTTTTPMSTTASTPMPTTFTPMPTTTTTPPMPTTSTPMPTTTTTPMSTSASTPMPTTSTPMPTTTPRPTTTTTPMPTTPSTPMPTTIITPTPTTITTPMPTTTTPIPTTTTPMPTTSPMSTTTPTPSPTTTLTPSTTASTTTTVPSTATTTTLPLSKIPLQFSLQVDGPAPSCIEGEYLPLFLHPTPHHGELLQARVNHELEIRVKAFASASRIIDVIISGPLNSSKTKTTSGEYVINWTPTEGNLGQHFPFCFIAEGIYQSDIYQSEMRCVVVKVIDQGPVAHVTCTSNSMSVTVVRSSIKNLHGDHLRLIDQSCQVYTNSTDVFTSTSLTGCGTKMEENDNELIFKNKIITFDDPRDIITRNHKLELEILCKYQKRSNVSLEFNTHRQPIQFSEKSFGTFNYQFEFYLSNSFQYMQDPKSYPLEYDVGDKIYMKIEPVTPVQNTEVFLESCVATPYDNPNYPVSYPIITNGCEVDGTVQFFSSHNPYVEFEMEAFEFLGFDEVFISCSIIICQANNPNTRCSQGCNNSTVAPMSHHQHKREALIQTASHFISQGPLRIKRSTSQIAVNQSLNVNLLVIAGTLMAMMAMVCGVIVYRSKRPKIRYQPVPSYAF